MTGKRRIENGFTLIELLVVIAIIALLLSIIMPALRLAKEQARKVVCKSNLSQLAKAIEMYEMNYDYKRFSVRNNAADTNLYWMGKLADYAGNDAYGEQFQQGEKIDLLLCPSAPYSKFTDNAVLQNDSGQYASAAAPWEWQRNDDMSTIGSYTINGGVAFDWMYDDPTGDAYDPVIAQRAYDNWMRTPSNVPVFGCGRWTIAWPDSGDPWPGAWGAPGEVSMTALMGDQPCTDYQLDRFCIDRHNKQVNIVFKGLHVETKNLEELWNLKWNKAWDFPSFQIRFVP